MLTCDGLFFNGSPFSAVKISSPRVPVPSLAARASQAGKQPGDGPSGGGGFFDFHGFSGREYIDVTPRVRRFQSMDMQHIHTNSFRSRGEEAASRMTSRVSSSDSDYEDDFEDSEIDEDRRVKKVANTKSERVKELEDQVRFLESQLEAEKMAVKTCRAKLRGSPLLARLLASNLL